MDRLGLSIVGLPGARERELGSMPRFYSPLRFNAFLGCVLALIPTRGAGAYLYILLYICIFIFGGF
jgi:hypothetical protein